MAPHGCYPCKGDDRWCVIAIRSQEEWIRFCEIAGHREWLSDHRFAELAGRLQYREELDHWIEKWTMRHTPHQVMLLLQRAGIAAGAVQTAEDLYRDPHLRERGSAREVFHPQTGWVTRAGPSARTASSTAARKEFAHVSGEDTEAVLDEVLGMSRAEIRELIDRRVVR
jgi:crotonobetainyl-CoA:carnitine CoA-transferase CaiB-like acyl-CoA transferase